VVLAVNILGTGAMPSLSGLLLAAYCVAGSFITLALPAVGIAFPPSVAGRALSAFNLVIFLGVFVIQWGIGLLTDALVAAGLTKPHSLQVAMSVLLLCCLASYIHFLRAARHNCRT
jgi:hypothetical protein